MGRVEEYVDPGMAIVGLVLLRVLDRSDDAPIHFDRVDDLLRVEQAVHGHVRTAWSPPSSHFRLFENGPHARPIFRLEASQDDALADY
jgi:hypothetical protein